MVPGQGPPGQIVRAANANGKGVAAAAARLHLQLTPHAVVAQRVTAAVGRIDACLNAARRRGDPVRHTNPGWNFERGFDSSTGRFVSSEQASASLPSPREFPGRGPLYPRQSW